jgi:agmatine deiminase
MLPHAMKPHETPRALGFRQPAEWQPHQACWVAWPSHADLWLDALPEVQGHFAAFCRAIGEGERLEVLVLDAAGETAARAALAEVPARFHHIPFGDIWLRDTAPIFLRSPSGEVAAATFAFNGWGGKYVLEHDDRVSERVAGATGLRTFRFPIVLEGGAVETDGEGTLVTTRQCLQSQSRNPGLGAGDVERALCDALGADRVLWLGEGLQNDHTDGHVDTLARFVAPGRVVCMEARDADDPNAAVLARIARDLAAMTDARGRRLEVERLPSPGCVRDGEGRVLPASYANFYVGNRTVAVPTYGSPHDAEAVERVGALFPGRRSVGIPARALLGGGGAFHCITQQQPRGKS